MAVSNSKKALRGALNCVVAGGVLLALWPLGQTAYGVWSQRQLKAQFQQETVSAAPTAAPLKTATAKIPKSKAAKSEKWSSTRLLIPDISLDAIVVSGVEDDDLRHGPGHEPDTALPGQIGNCVIAGHRNIYGSFFYHLDELHPGSTIELQTKRDKFRYMVVSVFSAAYNDQLIWRPNLAPGQPILTLYTCTLPHTSNRIVVQAVLAS